MVNQTLLNFVRTTLQSGYTEEQIRKGLVAKGWPQTEIDAAFALLNQEREQKILQEKEVKEKITESEIKEAFSKPKPSKFNDLKNNLSLKNIGLTALSFVVIFVVLGFTLLVFYYMTGLMDYTVLDPSTGNVVTGKCYKEDCADMKEFAKGIASAKLLFAVLVSLGAALIITVVYKLIKWKGIFLWTINILYFIFLAIIIYLWVSFTTSLS